MILTSFAEILSIGAVLPFLGALTAPERIFEHPAAQPFIRSLGLVAPTQLLLPLTAIFSAAVLLAGAMRLFLLSSNLRLSFAAGADLCNGVYRHTLYQPYAVHVARNSSALIAAVSSKANGIIYSIITPVLTLMSAGIILLALLLGMLIVEPLFTLAAFAGFSIVYGFIIGVTRNQRSRHSRTIARESTQAIKSLQEGLGGIRDILIDGSQEAYCRIYRDTDRRLRQAQGSHQFLSQSPRYGIEALGMLLIAIMAYLLAQQSNGIAMAIPVLGTLALAAQRLLPLSQQMYMAWSSILNGRASLQDTLDLLDQPLPEYADRPTVEPIRFQKHIRLNHVSFRYIPQTPWLLDRIDLLIEKGSRVGIVGTTGTGKSTLLDIVMALLQPVEGVLEIDDQPITASNQRAWQAHIAHVPQTVFLADSTLVENIAFGIDKGKIDHQRVRQAAQRAQIADLIETWPQQYQTLVGERGIRLSGGQRQRIGIARALYKRADVLVFDEATNALDSETEQAVMDTIDQLGDETTVLIVAHRRSTLKKCTLILELNDGEIKQTHSQLDYKKTG